MKNNLVTFPVKSVEVPKKNDRFAKGIMIGDSLIDKNIFDGDEFIVDTVRAIGNGDLAVVKIPFGQVARFIYFEPLGKVRLESANENHPPLIFNLADVKLIGKATHLVRRLENE